MRSLMDAYAAYGENDALIREGTAFLAQFPNDARRLDVALQVGDVYSRTNQPEKEFALYRGLLKQLAARAGWRSARRGGSEYSKQVMGDNSAHGRPRWPAPLGLVNTRRCWIGISPGWSH